MCVCTLCIMLINLEKKKKTNLQFMNHVAQSNTIISRRKNHLSKNLSWKLARAPCVPPLPLQKQQESLSRIREIEEGKEINMVKHHSSKRAQNAVEHWQEMAIVTILSTTVVNKSMNIQPLSSLKVIMVLIPQNHVFKIAPWSSSIYCN